MTHLNLLINRHLKVLKLFDFEFITNNDQKK